MTVIHNEVPANTNRDNGMGFLLGVVLLLLFAFLLFYYGLPMIRSSISTTQVNVPSKVDINVRSK